MFKSTESDASRSPGRSSRSWGVGRAGLGHLRRGSLTAAPPAPSSRPSATWSALAPRSDRLPDRLRDRLRERTRHRDGDALPHGLPDGELHRHAGP